MFRLELEMLGYRILITISMQAPCRAGPVHDRRSVYGRRFCQPGEVFARRTSNRGGRQNAKPRKGFSPSSGSPAPRCQLPSAVVGMLSRPQLTARTAAGAIDPAWELRIREFRDRARDAIRR